MKFSKILVSTVILLAIAYVIATITIFATKEIEISTAFHGFVFTFLGVELLALAKIKLTESKGDK